MFVKRLLSRTKLAWVVAGILFLLVIASFFLPLPQKDFRPESVHSLRIVDRNGILLREFLNDRQGRGQWRPLSEIAPVLQQATIAIEDKRFGYHPGIDPLALVRALRTDIKSGRFRSGGSTITQQVIRNVYHQPRTLVYKVVEAWYALRLERMMSKSAILEQYLNRVPYGNQLVGAEAASRFYFGKPARDLSLAEAAFLAGLPNAPSVLNPYSNFDDAIERQRVVLSRMRDEGMVSEALYRQAREQPVDLVSPEVNFRSPHLVEMAAAAVDSLPSAALVHTTIDEPLQERIRVLVRGHLKQLKNKNVTNAAVVVIDNRTMEVRALLGSADYFDASIQGQVNGALARRQPGSSVKPFTYALAFEGPFSPSDIIPDIPTKIPDERGDYIPENYDRKYHGPVRIRTALACSYNVPAVRVLKEIGTENLLQRMLLAGLTTLDQPSSYYGYGLTLGNGEVTLFEMTQAYALFAHGGVWNPARFIDSVQLAGGIIIRFPARGSQHRVFDGRAVSLVTDILKDPGARQPAFGHAFRFPFECAVKTGTTKDYRDNWTLGYTTEYTVGVWAGNFDGSAMRGVSGVTGAGQIFTDVMATLHLRGQRDLPPPFDVPAGLESRLVCALSGKLPSEACSKLAFERFIKGKVPTERCMIHGRFRFMDASGRAVTKVFEVFPAEYESWVRDQSIPEPPNGAVQLLDESDLHAESSRLSILSPQNGQIYKIDPILRKEYQTIRILAHLPPGISDVRVHVNGTDQFPYGSAATWWTLKRGNHRFQLDGKIRGRKVTSRPVTISVE